MQRCGAYNCLASAKHRIFTSSTLPTYSSKYAQACDRSYRNLTVERINSLPTKEERRTCGVMSSGFERELVRSLAWSFDAMHASVAGGSGVRWFATALS